MPSRRLLGLGWRMWGTSKGHGELGRGSWARTLGGIHRGEGAHTRLQAGWTWRQGPYVPRGAEGKQSWTCKSSMRHRMAEPAKQGPQAEVDRGTSGAAATGQRVLAGLGDGLAGLFSLPLVSCGA
ncbi:unnamed protein product [Rangifer tarandus platyrhynchus]|uniref:Uncharacterized protein n=1 Tax=Rangifer tarandus platyrhynchus TaxID=3082113 RepID=A0AC59ZCI8_RANTA